MTEENKQDPIDALIEQLADEIRYEEPGTEKFDNLIKQLGRAKQLKQDDSKPLFNPDTLLSVGGNLLGILLILNYERLNVVTTKALGFVIRSRL